MSRQITPRIIYKKHYGALFKTFSSYFGRSNAPLITLISVASCSFLDSYNSLNCPSAYMLQNTNASNHGKMSTNDRL
jgi:hypothetical protein